MYHRIIRGPHWTVSLSVTLSRLSTESQTLCGQLEGETRRSTRTWHNDKNEQTSRN